MRYAAYLLIVVSLIAGSLAATTAYAPRLAEVAAAGEPLTLAAPAGRDPAQPDRPAVAPGDASQPQRLTADVVERLAGLNVQRVRVKEFSLARWDEAWVFALALAGLVAGGLMVRRESRLRLIGPDATGTAGAAAPAAALEDAARDLEALRQSVAATPAEGQAAEILRGVEAIQAAHLAPFIAARPALMARLGVAGYARLMDPLAVGERHLNRAWSAAADHVLPEARASLDQAHAALAMARERLDELTR